MDPCAGYVIQLVAMHDWMARMNGQGLDRGLGEVLMSKGCVPVYTGVPPAPLVTANLSAMVALTNEEGMALLVSSLGEDIAAGEEDDAA